MRNIRLCIIGNGMVAHRFLEELTERCDPLPDITLFGEEPRPAYDRVHLSSWFTLPDEEALSLVDDGFYEKYAIRVFSHEPIVAIDRQRKEIHSAQGRITPYDLLVIATGSSPFVPPIPGREDSDCFVYRTIEDLQAIKACAARSQSGVVIGGGLLGLEAAGALQNLGMETHVVEFAPVLMAEQLDSAGGKQLGKKIEQLGVRVHTGKNTLQITSHQDQPRKTLHFADGCQLETDFIVFSAGIRPRDDLARQCGLPIGERGGILINDHCQTEDPAIYAIGECACWRQQCYGLVAPGYQMARIAAATLCGDHALFQGAETHAKLKLLGVDVAGLGDTQGCSADSLSYVYLNEQKGIYKRLIVSADQQQLLGAVLVGDTADYADFAQRLQNRSPLPDNPEQLILPESNGAPRALSGTDSLPDSAQICCCYDVSKGELLKGIAAGHHTVEALKSATRAGTGCGGCLPLLTRVLNTELSRQGVEVSQHLCEHFPWSRQQLFHLIRTGNLRTFDALLAEHGQGYGCEVCKPVVASLLASAWNEFILQPALVPLQDSNDNFLANLQKDGTYSVIPRSPGGEITPHQLMILGEVAQQYSLYSKITGSQRIALFGAHQDDLPAIWQQLLAAGFETGHAYAKALRMAKTCVGNRWCRFGVGDSTRLGVMLENRYKGIRTPHKMKFGVSGCTRECAEAQSKDIGVIATEKGWNLFVCGNGGMKPRHADLLAADLDEATLLRYIDRFMFFYLRTADKLQRTSVWLENLEGGIRYLQKVIIEDHLSMAESAELLMQTLRESYRCEWQETLNQPQALKRFHHFINSPLRDSLVQNVPVGMQHRPARPEERIAIREEESQ